MRKNPRRILSPQRLPFRHPGDWPFKFSEYSSYPQARRLHFRGRRIDGSSNPRDAISGKSPLPGVHQHCLLIRRNINAIKLIVRDVALHPLHSRHFAQHAARSLRQVLQFRRAHFPQVWNFPLNQIFRHLAFLAPIVLNPIASRRAFSFCSTILKPSLHLVHPTHAPHSGPAPTAGALTR